MAAKGKCEKCNFDDTFLLDWQCFETGSILAIIEKSRENCYFAVEGNRNA
jgi:hypothetical protein